MMNKKLFRILTSVSLVAAHLVLGANAAPALAGTQDTALEYLPVPEQIVETENKYTDNKSPELTSSGPAPVLVQDTAFETNTEFGTPMLLGDAILMSSLTGDGTEESPYLISDADDLFLMAHNVNTGVGNTAHYKLTNNIDLGGSEWAPIGHYTQLNGHNVSFSGVFDGDGHTISNFKITKEDTYYIGLFGLVSGGTIKNLNVDNVNIDVDFASTQTLYVGTLVGRMVTTVPQSLSSITRCNVTNSSITAENFGTIYAGGLAGSVISGNFINASIFITFTNN